MYHAQEVLAFLFEKNKQTHWLDDIPPLPGQEDSRWSTAYRRLDALVYALRMNGFDAKPCSAQVGGVDVARFRGLLLPDVKEAHSVFDGTIQSADREVAGEFFQMKRAYTAHARGTLTTFEPRMAYTTFHQDLHAKADPGLRAAMDQGVRLVEDWQYEHAAPEFQAILDQRRAAQQAQDLDQETPGIAAPSSASPRL